MKNCGEDYRISAVEFSTFLYKKPQMKRIKTNSGKITKKKKQFASCPRLKIKTYENLYTRRI